MLKKFGLVAVGVTAGLVAVAPLASAADHGQTSCSSTSDAKGNSGLVNQCNITGQHVGEGNHVIIAGIPVLP